MRENWRRQLKKVRKLWSDAHWFLKMSSALLDMSCMSNDRPGLRVPVEVIRIMEFGKVRANIIIETRKWFAEKFTKEKISEFLGAISAEERQIWMDEDLRPNDMLPAAIYRNLYDVGVPVLGDGDPEFFRKGAANTAQAEIEKSMHAFIRYGMPSFIGRQMVMVWRHYFSVGSLSVDDYTENSINFSLEFAQTYGRAGCCGTEGWVRKALEIAGAKDIQFLQPECVFKGDERCLIRFYWKFLQ